MGRTTFLLVTQSKLFQDVNKRSNILYFTGRIHVRLSYVRHDTERTTDVVPTIRESRPWCLNLYRSLILQIFFRRFAAKYYHRLLLKLVSVIFAVLEVSF